MLLSFLNKGTFRSIAELFRMELGVKGGGQVEKGFRVQTLHEISGKT
jgi:hypothetical protein